MEVSGRIILTELNGRTRKPVSLPLCPSEIPPEIEPSPLRQHLNNKDQLVTYYMVLNPTFFWSPAGYTQPPIQLELWYFSPIWCRVYEWVEAITPLHPSAYVVCTATAKLFLHRTQNSNDLMIKVRLNINICCDYNSLKSHDKSQRYQQGGLLRCYLVSAQVHVTILSINHSLSPVSRNSMASIITYGM